jgi:hypothetical protein
MDLLPWQPLQFFLQLSFTTHHLILTEVPFLIFCGKDKLLIDWLPGSGLLLNSYGGSEEKTPDGYPCYAYN